jgi:hypothetical protein
MEMRGVHLEEILSFFREKGWREIRPGVWQSDFGTVVTGRQKEIYLGSIRLPSVKLVFRLNDMYYDDFLSSFRSRFRKAGG